MLRNVIVYNRSMEGEVWKAKLVKTEKVACKITFKCAYNDNIELYIVDDNKDRFPLRFLHCYTCRRSLSAY